ncbi:MAG TPA: tetratricopeptide repeat protein [Thermoanaerobaculia bacterium]|nr:tetratricopeptide repeat protein [Thermoanaerobaculia bacterium]
MKNAAPVLALLLLMTNAAPSWASSFFDGLERAVVLRQPERLSEYQEILRREIDLLGGRTWGPGDLRAYTLAYVNTRLSPILPGTGKAERARLLEEAEAALRQTLQANPRDAEAYALLGAVYGAQISLTPLKALTLGPRVASAFAAAEKLAPKNPRVSLQKGISLLFVPRAFGGGPEASLRELRRAETLFAQEPAGKPWPNWGRPDVLAWLGRALAQKGDREAARAAYERALALEPDYVWVRRILIPELGR